MKREFMENLITLCEVGDGRKEKMEKIKNQGYRKKMKEEERSTSWVFHVPEEFNKVLISWKLELKGKMVQKQNDIIVESFKDLY